MKPLSLTQLRANLYQIVDHAISTGHTVEINRNGRKIRLVPEKKQSKLNNLVKHPGTIVCDPEDLVHMDWSKYWKGKKEL